ncbi:MAG: S8 family serine peptidase [Candidatus Cloacimonetes bacterium]|nr:S8 family serine peptidase [Candidatus Cloacimonadota bacterium]
MLVKNLKTMFNLDSCLPKQSRGLISEKFRLISSKMFRVILLFSFFFLADLALVAQTNEQELLRLSQQFTEKYEREKAEAIRVAKEKGWVIRREFPDGRIIEIQRLAPNGMPIYYTTTNLNAAKTVGTDELWPGGASDLNLTGDGFLLGEWDGGGVRTTHRELTGRVTQQDIPAGLSSHSTHVAGTIIASGVDINAKGMAYQADLDAYDWNNDQAEMANAADSLLLSNHSYGAMIGWDFCNHSTPGVDNWHWFGNISISATESFWFGFYNSWAADWDTIAYYAPDYLIVQSAGNDRTDNHVGWHRVWEPDSSKWVWSDDARDPDGNYDCIPPRGTAKNVLTVGAVDDIPGGYNQPADVVMSTFSSWGPCDDGRIKPDIVANGVNLWSCDDDHNSDYTTKSGTSMSTPNVCGTLGLLQGYYHQLNDEYMTAAMLKGLAINTADEAGPNIGPDYMFGWGLFDAEGSANLITKDNEYGDLICEYELNNSATDEFVYYSDGSEDITVTVCWTDPPGTPVAPALNPSDKMLVNDLDLKLIEEIGTEIFPWKLNKDAPILAATTGDNDIDNVEQVFIDNPDAGFYTIRVSHKGDIGNGQDYSLIISGMKKPGTWEGSVSNNWNNADNWSADVVPIDLVDVTIPADYTHYPEIYSTDAECNSLTIESNATLRIFDEWLIVNGDLTIYGTLEMWHPDAILFVHNDVYWKSGATATINAYNSMKIAGDWYFEEGANIHLDDGAVSFLGNDDSIVYMNSDNCYFNYLGDYKSNGAHLGISCTSTDTLIINNDLYLHSNSILYGNSSYPTILKGNFTSNGTFEFYTGDFIFDGSEQYIHSDVGNFFNNLYISSSNNTTMGNPAVNGDFTVNGNLTIDEGTLNLNGYTCNCKGNVTINNGCKISIDDNACLKVGGTDTLTVNNGGTLEVIGSNGNEAKISHDSDYYDFNINSGATISAEYTIFEYMNSNGVNVKSGAIIDTDHNFSNCTFQNGASSGTLLTISNNQNLTLYDVSFPANNWGSDYNVSKPIDKGQLSFDDATGAFAGESFDNDPYDRITWSFAPAAPQNLHATAGIEKILLEWDANSEPDLHKYNIYRDTSYPITTLIDSVVGTPANPNYLDTGLIPGQFYYYSITAVDDNGYESSYSLSASAKPLSYESDNVVFVATDGSDITGDGTINNPYKTIQHGMDVVAVSDTVLIKIGTYTENIDFIGKDIVVGSYYLITSDTSYISQTIIDGNSSKSDSSCVYFTNNETSSAMLVGLTIQNGRGGRSGSSPYTYWGGGITCRDHSDPTISYCTIINNTTARYGGGICCSEFSDPTINYCTIYDNTSDYGGAGIVCFDSNPDIVNCLIKDNVAGSGGGALDLSCTGTHITNCTIVGNTGEGMFESGIFVYSNSTVFIRSSILWGNSEPQVYNLDDCTVYFSDIQNQTPSSGWFCIDSDPLFVNEAQGNYQLSSSSPCIDAGDPNASVPEGGGIRIDMGNEEYTGNVVTKSVQQSFNLYSFGASMVQMFVTDGSGQFTVTHHGSNHPSAPHSIERYATIILNSGSPTVNLKFYYEDSELDGNVENDLNLWRWTGDSWVGPIEPNSSDTEENWVQITGQTSFSDWVISDAEDEGTLPVELLSFTAVYSQDNSGNEYVTVNWSTASETDVQGFNIYRSEYENLSTVGNHINASLIEGAGTTTEPQHYSFIDDIANPYKTYYYWLESVDFGGISEYHEPVKYVPGDIDGDNEVDLYSSTILYNNYPNPATNKTSIKYQLKGSVIEQDAVISIYNIKGELVKTIKGKKGKVEFDVSDLATGIYFYQLKTSNFNEVRKMIVIQ